MKRLLLLLLLCLCMFGCSTPKKTMKYETYEEYVTNFIQAVNEKDTKLLDALLSKDATIYYDMNHAEIELGKAEDENSYLYYLLQIDTILEGKQIVDGASENTRILEALHTNHIYNDIYKTDLTEYTYYEFLIENNEITYIYVYCNDEELYINEQYTEAQIGIEYSRADTGEYLLVTTVYEGSVAAVLGIEEGNQIYAIDDMPVADMNMAYDEPSSWLCGKDKTQVKLLLKQDAKESRDVYLTRQLYREYQYTDEVYLDEE